MSSKTDLVNASQREDRRSRTIVVILMPESDPPQSSKNVAAADARKLLSVVAIELAFVFLVTSGAFFNRTEDICTFVKSHQWIYIIALLVVWMMIQVLYMFYVVCFRRLPLPLLSFGNVLIFVLTTLCLTLICVFITICADLELIIQALGTTLGNLLLVIVVAVLTPLDTSGWGKQLLVMAIILGLADFVMLLTSEFLPVSIQLHIFLILGIIFVVLFFFNILHHLQTIVGGEMDKDDGWRNACLLLFCILYVFVMLLQLCELMRALQVQVEKSS